MLSQLSLCARLSFFLPPLPHPPRSTPFPYTTLFRSPCSTGSVEDQPVALDEGPEGHTLQPIAETEDRKSTRLNSSHRCISYAVFCLKKKTDQIGQLDQHQSEGQAAKQA